MDDHLGRQFSLQDPEEDHVHAIPPHTNGTALSPLLHEPQASQDGQGGGIPLERRGADASHPEASERLAAKVP